VGLSPLTLAPLPPEAATPTGLFPAPCVPPLPAWPIRASLRSLPFPRQCANAAPTLSLSHCPVSGPHGGGHRPSRLARGVQVGTPTPVMGYGGRFGMTPCCIVLVCSWRHLLANRHSRPFPWTLSLHSMGGGADIQGCGTNEAVHLLDIPPRKIVGQGGLPEKCAFQSVPRIRVKELNWMCREPTPPPAPGNQRLFLSWLMGPRMGRGDPCSP